MEKLHHNWPHADICVFHFRIPKFVFECQIPLYDHWISIMFSLDDEHLLTYLETVFETISRCFDFSTRSLSHVMTLLLCHTD